MIPFDDFGGRGPLLHFGHANGYPPGAYKPLLDRFVTSYHVMAMRMRPLWPGTSPQSFKDWRPLADDLLQFIDQLNSSSLISVGHSMGATTALRLALRHPKRFQALVLIDPVLFPPLFIHWYNLVHFLGLSYRIFPFARNALRRRNTFDNKQVMFENYRQKTVFSRFDDTSLMAYVDALAESQPDGSIRLAFPPAWEGHLYVTGMRADMELWRDLSSLKPPVLVIRGAVSNTFWESTAELFSRRLPTAQIAVIPDATHLVPLEKPQQTADLIFNYLSKLEKMP